MIMQAPFDDSFVFIIHILDIVMSKFNRDVYLSLVRHFLFYLCANSLCYMN